MKNLQIVFVVILVLAMVGLVGVQIWSGQQNLAAERERTRQIVADAEVAGAQARKDLARLEEEGPRKLAKLREDLARSEADLKEAVARTKATQARAAIQQRIIAIAHAYLDAQVALGRPPRELAELKPHLKREEDLLAPRSGKPFGIAWNQDAVAPITGGQAPKHLLVWEPEPDQDGGRWVMPAPPGIYGCQYAKESDFQRLLQAVRIPEIPVIPPPSVEKQNGQPR